MLTSLAVNLFGAWNPGKTRPTRFAGKIAINILLRNLPALFLKNRQAKTKNLVAHDCGYPPSHYTCRATRVAADFLDFIALCRCSRGVAPHPLKFWCRTVPPPIRRRCRTEIWVWKGVTLHGGVAGTVASVALHCATKTKNHPKSALQNLELKNSRMGKRKLRGLLVLLLFWPYGVSSWFAGNL